MDRTPVDSSNIATIGYDPDTKTLEIEFKGGGVYNYADVPKAMYTAFMAAGSKGKYFAEHIRRNFSFSKV